eukprot:2126-Prorocentrum_minimum.AAC.1
MLTEVSVPGSLGDLTALSGHEVPLPVVGALLWAAPLYCHRRTAAACHAETSALVYAEEEEEEEEEAEAAAAREREEEAKEAKEGEDEEAEEAEGRFALSLTEEAALRERTVRALNRPPLIVPSFTPLKDAHSNAKVSIHKGAPPFKLQLGMLAPVHTTLGALVGDPLWLCVEEAITPSGPPMDLIWTLSGPYLDLGC